MIIGQKYVNKKEIINKIIKRIEEGVNDIEKNITIAGICFLGLMEDLIETKIEVLKVLKESPVSEEFNPDIYTEDVNACKLVYGDIEAEYHLRLEGNDKVRGMDFLLFEDILNPQDNESFETEIELLAEEITKECGNLYNFENIEISYVKLTHSK